ncbi:MAG: hypothetical protein GY719_29370 [bacterium]|nr:hypothetical protein [bacterium]
MPDPQQAEPEPRPKSVSDTASIPVTSLETESGTAKALPLFLQQSAADSESSVELQTESEEERQEAGAERIILLHQLLVNDDEESAIELMGELNRTEVAFVLSNEILKERAVSAFWDDEMYRAVRAMRGDLHQSLRWLFAEGTNWSRVRGVVLDSPSGRSRILSDAAFKDDFADVCDNEEMAEAVDLLGGTLLQKLTWMAAEGSSWPLVKAKIEATKDALQKVALYDSPEMLDFFVDVCSDETMARAVRKLGGTLLQRLTWMKTEGSRWPLVSGIVAISPESERLALYDSKGMREFFISICDNKQMKRAVDMLGGDLSQQMGWLRPEGSDYSPRQAEEPPSISPRNEAHLERLEGKHHLYDYIKEYKKAVVLLNTFKNFAKSEERKEPDATEEEQRILDEYLEEGIKAQEEEVGRLKARLDRELAAGDFADIEDFLELASAFEDFFLGYCLQIAHQMLDENEAIAKREKGRYSRDPMRFPSGVESGFEELWLALEPVRQKIKEVGPLAIQLRSLRPRTYYSAGPMGPDGSGKAERRRETQLKLDKLLDESRSVLRSLSAEFPILADPSLVEGSGVVFVGTADKKKLRELLGGTALSVISNIQETRENLREDTSLVWQMDPVVARALVSLGIVQGSVYDAILKDKLGDLADEEAFRALMLAALAIVLGLVSFGTGTVAVLAAGASFVLSAWVAVESYQEYEREIEAAGTAFDRARALSAQEPSLFWLALDIIGAIADLGGLFKALRAAGAFKAFRALSVPALAVSDAKTAGEAALAVEDFKRVAVKTELELGDSEGFAAYMVESLQRQEDRVKLLKEESEAVLRIKEQLPDLDDFAVAGILRLEQATAATVIEGLGHNSQVVQRLAYLAEAGSATDNAFSQGLEVLRRNFPEDDFLLVVEDLTLRRDTTSITNVIETISSGRVSEQEIQRIAESLKELELSAERVRAFERGLEDILAQNEQIIRLVGKPIDKVKAELEALGYTVYQRKGKSVIAVLKKEAKEKGLRKLHVGDGGLVFEGLRVSTRIGQKKFRADLLRAVMQLNPDFVDMHQAHHLIPHEAVDNSELFRVARELGVFDVDDVSNGVLLPKESGATDAYKLPVYGDVENLPFHRTSHDVYNKKVMDEADKVWNDLTKNGTKMPEPVEIQDAIQEMQEGLIEHLMLPESRIPSGTRKDHLAVLTEETGESFTA